MNMRYTFIRIMLSGIRGFRRNIWLSVIAVITITMTLLTLTVFALGNLVAQQRYSELNNKIDYLIFINDEASEADVALLKAQIEERPEVNSVIYTSKDEARLRFEESFSENDTLRGIITQERNPLFRELAVKFDDVKTIQGFDDFVKQDRYQQLIFMTSYQENQEAINNYVRVTGFLRLIAFAFTFFFTIISLLVVLNTIRLTIHSRRDEVEIMRIVGASPAYIRGPFIVEGIFYGLIATIISALLTWGLLTQLEALVSQSFGLGTTNVLTELFGSTFRSGSGRLTDTIGYLFGLQLVVGILLGAVCSIIAIRRYLKEQ